MFVIRLKHCRYGVKHYQSIIQEIEHISIRKDVIVCFHQSQSDASLLQQRPVHLHVWEEKNKIYASLIFFCLDLLKLYTLHRLEKYEYIPSKCPRIRRNFWVLFPVSHDLFDLNLKVICSIVPTTANIQSKL